MAFKAFEFMLHDLKTAGEMI